MARNYITGDIVNRRADMARVDLDCGDLHEKDLSPRRLFPITDPDHYISFLNADGHEVAVIADIHVLSRQSRAVLEDVMKEYYLIPKILEVLEIDERFGMNKWTVRTERGVQSFQIRSRHSDIKPFADGRVLIRDSNDNRYEIEDWRTHSKASKKWLNTQI
ncbi:MAG: DUF1854 domain-containing protein [Clostridia bacterium]|nr:DUF1854 domain-containing protein [Clostridia bacterium]